VLVVVVLVLVVFVVVVFGAVVVCFVVTGGVLAVEVDFVVVVVTGATGVAGALAVVVTTGAALVVVAVVLVELWVTTGFLWWAFLWCAAFLCGAAATDEVVLEVVEAVELVGAVGEDEALGPPELPHPAITVPAISVSSAAFIRSPLVVPRLLAKANNA
jgi:hypothetical protein